MSVFDDVREEIKATLETAGLTKVTLDPRGQPPMILVDAPSLVETEHAGATWTVTVPVRIIHPPPGDATALGWMLTQLEPVMLALGAASARSGTYALDNNKDQPAFTVTVDRQVIVPCD
jgi:hypothetical protein